MVADGWAHRGISAPSVFESHSLAAALEISRMTFLVSGSESDTESPAVARLASQEASLAAPEKGVSTKSVAPSPKKERRGVNSRPKERGVGATVGRTGNNRGGRK